MSTKPIREALERIQCTCRDHSCVGCKAEAAVSAIERAAKIIAKATENGWPTTPMGSLNLQHSFELLGSIAKDPP